ncbi:MAG: DMT family transporter [Cyanobacteria bacterium P01_H01_bin.130]
MDGMAGMGWIGLPDGTLGIGAALSAAFCWAIATRLFSSLGGILNPAWLNCLKGAIAITLFLLTLLGRSLATGEPWLSLTGSEMGFLALSGVLGIGLGDTAYFESLNRLGPRLSLLLESGAPIVTATLAWIFLQEALSVTALLGMAIAVGGITWTLAEQTAPDAISPSPSQSHPRAKLQGILWGIVAALSQAGGSVIARGTLAASTVDPQQSGLVRLVAGSMMALAIATVTHLFKSPISAPEDALPPKRLRLPFHLSLRLLLATFLGTYLGISLQQTALKFTFAGIAQTCLATSPLFILPILWLTGERLSYRAIAGALVTVGGIVILVQG